MKILIVIPYFMPAISYGGPVKVAYDLARGLVRRGHEVTVATTDALDDKDRVVLTREILAGMNVIRFRNLSNLLAKKVNGYLPLNFIPWIIKNAQEFDVVHCHDVFSLQTLVTGSVCGSWGVPYLIQPHGSLSPVRRSARFYQVKRGILGAFRSVLARASGFVALTEEEKESIAATIKTGKEKTAVIPNGLDHEDFLRVEPMDLHHRFGIRKGQQIIGFIGRLAYIKGLDISLDVLSRLKDRHDFTFLIIGPDEGEQSRLIELADHLGLTDRIIFAGTLDGRDKLRVVRSCDLFLFTSRDEGLPMTVLEVAALGVPQVISTECHVPEVAEYRAGFVHPCHDVSGFTASLERLLDGYADKNVMGANAQQMVRERFSAEQVLDQLESLLARAVAGSGASRQGVA